MLMKHGDMEQWINRICKEWIQFKHILLKNQMDSITDIAYVNPLWNLVNLVIPKSSVIIASCYSYELMNRPSIPVNNILLMKIIKGTQW